MYRVQALYDRPWIGVYAGDLGGWVKKLHFPGCVSPTAWVGGEAEVTDIAEVKDYAVVSNNAVLDCATEVSGTARVDGNARITDNAQVTGSSHVTGDVCLAGNTQVHDCTVDGVGTITGNSVIRASITFNGLLIDADIQQPEHYQARVGHMKGSGRSTEFFQDKYRHGGRF